MSKMPVLHPIFPCSVLYPIFQTPVLHPIFPYAVLDPIFPYSMLLKEAPVLVPIFDRQKNWNQPPGGGLLRHRHSCLCDLTCET
jgi:hypothetical protein